MNWVASASFSKLGTNCQRESRVARLLPKGLFYITCRPYLDIRRYLKMSRIVVLPSRPSHLRRGVPQSSRTAGIFRLHCKPLGNFRQENDQTFPETWMDGTENDNEKRAFRPRAGHTSSHLNEVWPGGLTIDGIQTCNNRQERVYFQMKQPMLDCPDALLHDRQKCFLNVFS